MSQKTRYFSSLLCLAVFVSLSVVFVQRKRFEKIESQRIDKDMGLSVHDVKNPVQLRQVTIIQRQIQKEQSPNDEQIDQLLSVISGPPDVILQTKASIALISGAAKKLFSPSQKSKIAAKAVGNLKNPQLVLRVASVNLLGRLGEKSAVPALLPLLNDPDSRVRQVTQKALNRIQTPNSNLNR